MKLYYSPGACSLADHIALVEGGFDYDLVKVDLKTKRTEDGRDFLTVNSKGYVPALELDDGAVLTENIAILSYLADKDGTLMPAAGMGRWRVLEAAAFVSGELHKNFKPFFNPNASEAERDEARAVLVKRFGTIEASTGDRDFVVGDTMSIADSYLFVTMMWAIKMNVPLTGRLTAYFERIKARPAVQRALSEEGLG